MGNYQGNELTRNSSENVHPQPSQFAEPLWIDLGLKKNSTGTCKLISTYKKKIKNAGEEKFVELFLKVPTNEEKAATEALGQPPWQG